MRRLIVYLHIKEEYIVAEITNKQKLATVGYVEAILHKLQDWMPFKRKNGGILQDSKDDNGEQTLKTTNTGEIALGKYNNSDNETLLSVGIGSREERKNAILIKQNGEIFIITDITTGKVSSLQNALNQKGVTFCNTSEEFKNFSNEESLGKLLYLLESDDTYTAGLYVIGIQSNGGNIVPFKSGSDIKVDLSNYYTKEEVNILIDKINKGEIDLANYYTIAQVDEKIDKLSSDISDLGNRVDNIEDWIDTPISNDDLELIIGKDLDNNGKIGK